MKLKYFIIFILIISLLGLVNSADINLDLVYPTTNINVTQNLFFKVSVNVSCSNGGCGEINVTLDPDNWWDSSWKYRTPLYFNETRNLARTFEHVRLNISFSENKLKNENHTALVCDGKQVPFEGYALTMSNGWVTLLQGITEISFNAYENKTCYLYYDDLDISNENISFSQTGWNYACDNGYALCGTPGDISIYTADYFSNYTVLQNANLGCNGDYETFTSNMWCYFKSPSTGSINFATASDDGSSFLVENSQIINNKYCQGTTCRSSSTNLVKNRYYAIEVDYDENDGGNTLYVVHSTSSCSGATITGDYIDSECYGFFGDEWIINVANGNEEIYSKGVISTTTGATPFYTNITNPYNLTLNNGQSQIITWWVNATGTLNNNYTFFVYANLTSNLSIGNITHLWNVTIVNFTIDNDFPIVNFTNPTPASGTSTTNTSIQINISVSEQTLKSLIYNWNGTNYTIYNDSLVLMMNLDNISFLGENATHVKDLSRYGNNGTINGAVWNTSGKYGGAHSFDGINDYINISDNPCLRPTQFTIQSWIKIASTPTSYHPIVEKFYGSAANRYASYYLAVGSTETGIWIGTTDNTWNKATTPSYPSLGVWHYVVGTYNGTSLLFYLDGILNSSLEVSKTIDYNSQPIYIGQWGSNQYFNGLIDEVRIWNRSLSGSEINQIYMTNLQKFNSTQWYLYTNQSKNSTTGLDEGEYTYQAIATDVAGNTNQTETKVITIATADTIYPIFSSYYDNNSSLIEEGLAIFNVTILNTNRTVWFEINGTNYAANNISANTWNYSLTLTNGTYSYRWWAYGNGSSYLINNSGLRSYTISNYDLTAPQITILSPLNINYTISLINFSLSSNENLSLCMFSIDNWTTNYTMSINYSLTEANYTLANLEDNIYIARFWCNDTNNNINDTKQISFVVNTSAVVINSVRLIQYSIINGTNVLIYVDSSNSDYIFANITKPDSKTQIVILTNNANTTYSNTSLIGRYNITISANNSLGLSTTLNDYFESFLPITLNLSINDKNNTGVSTDWDIYYRNSLISSNSSSSGRVLHELPSSLVDLKLNLFSNNLSVLLKDINLSKENGKNFGADLLIPPVSGYILTYGINNTFNFTNATLKINYSSAEYTNESYLKFEKCDLWDFVNQNCSGTWTDITSSSTQDESGNIFEYLTTSFSGFGIKQGLYCGDGTCNNGEACSSCPSDCGACSTSSQEGGGGGGSKTVKECEKDKDCKGGYSCYKNQCVKLFDVVILGVEHLIDSGNFSLEYLVKGMANFSGDVVIKYWITNGKKTINLGQDVVYFGSFEEKTRITKLNLPLNIITGDYDLYIQAIFENYHAESFRKINLEELKKESKEEKVVNYSPSESSSIWKYAFVILGIILIFILSLKRYRKSTFYYINRIRQKGVLIEHDYLEITHNYLSKAKISLMLLWVDSVSLIKHLLGRINGKVGSDKKDNVSIIKNWAQKMKFNLSLFRHYIAKALHNEIIGLKKDIYRDMDFMVSQNLIRVYQIGFIKKSRYIGFGCCIGSLVGKRVYSRGGHLIGKVIQPVLDLVNKKIIGWLIKPDKRYKIKGQVLIYQKEFVTIGDIIFVDNRIREYIHNIGLKCQLNPDSKNKVCNPYNLDADNSIRERKEVR